MRSRPSVLGGEWLPSPPPAAYHEPRTPRGGGCMAGTALLLLFALAGPAPAGPAVVPGKPDVSLLIHAVEYRGETRMPPKGKLPDADVARLKRWVALGAPWPGSGKAIPTGEFRITDAQRRWWAFQPLGKTRPP